MRGRVLAGAVGLGCACLSVFAMLTLVPPDAAEAAPPGGQCDPRSDRRECQMPRGSTASDCEDAIMNTRPGGSGDVMLSASVANGARVAPGQDITIRLTWDPKAWSGESLDMALACVQVKGALDPDLSGRERPAPNDGVFEYRLHVPDNIRPDCDICVQGFLAGMTGDGRPAQVGSNEQCFMSGSPAPPRPPAPPATQPMPPATQPMPPATQPMPPATQPPVPATTPTTMTRVPSEVPAQVAGGSQERPAPAPAAAPAVDVAPVAELPRTGHSFAQVGTASAGFTMALGGLALIGGAGHRQHRRRPPG